MQHAPGIHNSYYHACVGYTKRVESKIDQTSPWIRGHGILGKQASQARMCHGECTFCRDARAEELCPVVDREPLRTGLKSELEHCDADHCDDPQRGQEDEAVAAYHSTP
jgi:hypothetical protein